MPKRSKTERAKSKTETAVKLGGLGGSIGSAVAPGIGTAIGASVGALTGLVIGDARYVFPVDMIAIPAYQYHLLSTNPTFQVYIRAGETLMPTGGNVEDVEQVMETEADNVAEKPKKRKTAYQRKYQKAFKSVAPKYKMKNGKWKTGGFRKAVKEAHKKAGGK